MSPVIRAARPILMLLVIGFGIGACRDRDEPAPVVLGPLPDWAEVRDAYNDRVSRLDRVWARATLQVISPDGDGGTRTDQGEGHLQLQRPASLSLSIGKVSQVLFTLGSNDDRYWWFDLTNDDERWGMSGRHALATPDKAREFGVPVHPLDLLELLGVMPLPDEGVLSWAPDGHYLVNVPSAFGRRVLWIDPDTLFVERVQLTDDRGETLIDADLSRYQNVVVEGDGSQAPRMPARVVALIPELESEVRLNLYDPEVSEMRPLPIAFDFATLVTRYRLEQVYDLDALEGGE